MDCVDYQNHENVCKHVRHGGGPGIRVSFEDGCRATACDDCFFANVVRKKQRFVAIAHVDKDGIPHNKESWTEADTLAAILRESAAAREGAKK